MCHAQPCLCLAIGHHGLHQASHAKLLAGTGKTALMRSKLAAMNPEQMCFSTINLSSFSDAPAVQTILEQPLEKKSGKPVL